MQSAQLWEMPFGKRLVGNANVNGYATLAGQVYAQDYALGAAHRM